jgi:predicted TIM-barrel fold metal-dependent hydrolase
MDIVDPQVHLWGAESPARPWPPGRSAEAQKPYPISKETLLFQMDLAGVRRIVIVPPSWEGDRNDLALEAARAARGRGSSRTCRPSARSLSIPTWP